MPTLFEYLGIVIKFYSNEHETIHVHAFYNDAEIKISFFIKQGNVYRTTFVLVHGKFPANKLKQLKKLISVYKNDYTNVVRCFYFKEKY
ncbi:MAG: DUF4160 domain-containing protein [Bacteroidales bacterium]|nr:DUF4160 domain-containing protein [Bacteroidales bacterium]